MRVSLSDGLRYPVDARRPADLLVAGGIVGIVAAMSLQLGVAVLPSLLGVGVLSLAGLAVLALGGYLLRVFTATVDGSDSPPGFRPLGGLLGDGARLAILAVSFAVGPLALVTITGVGLLRTEVATELTGFIGATAFFTAATVLLMIVGTFGYIFPVAVGQLADTNFRSVLSIDGYRSVLGDSSYAVGWLFAALILVPGWAFLFVAVSTATLFGVLSVFVSFYAHVVATRLVAVGYRESTAKPTRYA